MRMRMGRRRPNWVRIVILIAIAIHSLWQPGLIALADDGASELQPDTRQLLEEKREMWREVATDPELFGCWPQVPAKKSARTGGAQRPCDPDSHIQPAGDSVLFNALLCYSGEQVGCKAVRESQDDSGRWWRSPLHVDRDRDNTFSKDHALGSLLYLAVTKDKEAAQEWEEWLYAQADPVKFGTTVGETFGEDVVRELILNPSKCLAKGMPCVKNQLQELGNRLGAIGECLLGDCDDAEDLVEDNLPKWLDVPAARFCEEQHCIIPPGHYALMFGVWEHLDLEPTTAMELSQDVRSGKFADLLGEEESPSHLRAVATLIEMTTNSGDRNFSRQTIVSLNRDFPDNPFYQYLAYLHPSVSGPSLEEIAGLTLEPCSLTKEQYQTTKATEYEFEGATYQGDQWMWERPYDASEAGPIPERVVRDSMAWDCIFMANLLLEPVRRPPQENTIVGLRIADHDWTSGWTTAELASIGGETYLFLVKAGNGVVHIHKMNSDGTVGALVQEHDWSSGWTTAEFYSIDDTTYLFLLKAGTGDVHIHKMNNNGTVGPQIDDRDWSSGWTTAEFYTIDDTTYLFLQKAGRDDAHIQKMNDDGTVGPQIADYNWSSGWTTAEFYTIDDTNYLFLLKASTGDVHIHKMNSNGTVGPQIDDRDWSSGWTTAEFYTIDDTTYLFLQKAGRDDAHIQKMNDDGTVGPQIADYNWSSGWATAEFYTIDDTTYLFLLKAGTGDVHIHLMHGYEAAGSR